MSSSVATTRSRATGSSSGHDMNGIPRNVTSPAFPTSITSMCASSSAGHACFGANGVGVFVMPTQHLYPMTDSTENQQILPAQNLSIFPGLCPSLATCQDIRIPIPLSAENAPQIAALVEEITSALAPILRSAQHS